mgnify:FL=1
MYKSILYLQYASDKKIGIMKSDVKSCWSQLSFRHLNRINCQRRKELCMKRFKIIYLQKNGIQASQIIQAKSKEEAKGKWLQQTSGLGWKIVQIYEM